MPDVSIETERFNIPKVKGHIEGNKTVVNNFGEISKTLRRKPQHILRFVLKELATPGELRKDSIIFGAKISASKINEKINEYAETFVICKECGKPDSKLSKEGTTYILKCQACGAKASFYSKF